jgi:hypothetical protein
MVWYFPILHEPYFGICCIQFVETLGKFNWFIQDGVNNITSKGKRVSEVCSFFGNAQ